MAHLIESLVKGQIVGAVLGLDPMIACSQEGSL